jgi:hypothetical protein
MAVRDDIVRLGRCLVKLSATCDFGFKLCSFSGIALAHCSRLVLSLSSN